MRTAGDNGGPTMPGITVNGARNDPCRGSKRTTLEGGARVPFLISWPGGLKPGVFDQPVIQLDATATTLGIAGVDVKPEWTLHGANLLPFLSGEKTGAPHDALYWRFTVITGQNYHTRDLPAEGWKIYQHMQGLNLDFFAHTGDVLNKDVLTAK